MKAKKDYKILVPVSGGKDSQTCLKLAVAAVGADNVLGLFCDTKFEHPKTYKHIDDIAKLYGVDIVTVNGGSVLEKSIKYGRFPGGGARHCTDELKIRETKIYLKAMAERQGGFEVWYGMRSDESSERAKRYANKVDETLYHPHEIMRKYPKYLGEMGVRFKLPVLDWVTEQVFKYLDGEENPLYGEGFARVGCFPCLASGDRWKIKAFEHDDFGRSQREAVRQVEVRIGKSIWTSGIGDRHENSGQGCLICSI
ncbi:MAG: phosphoadenosine phosphosulfate reductase family protein [Gammaproteobacteria bacterium]|nr:phosphoadenosine phosphosulfate reductase family protein [Gammaproteobacteria bacterium]